MQSYNELLKFANTAVFNTVQDVKTFIGLIVDTVGGFHPDTPFEDYVQGETGEYMFNEKQAFALNDKLAAAEKFIEDKGTDLYELGMEEFKNRGLL